MAQLDVKSPLMGSKSPAGAPAVAGTPADLPAAVEAFRRCRKQDGTLATDHYLAAVNQLVRLFLQFGKAFELALQGLRKSIQALEILRVSGTGSHYKTFQGLVEHEKGLNIHGKQSSGTIHVLKVHRFLGFLLEFLSRVEDSLERDETLRGRTRVTAYQQTLGRYEYHPPLLQATIKLLLLRGPGRHEAVRKLGEAARGVTSPRDMLRALLAEAQPVQKALGKYVKETVEA